MRERPSRGNSLHSGSRRDVGDDDRFPPIGGRAARARLGTDAHAVDGLGDRRPAGSARRRDRKRSARLVEQQDRAEDPSSWDSTRAPGGRARRSSGALVAIISRICACPSRSVVASLRSVMSREMPTTPKISLRSLRSGTFVEDIQPSSGRDDDFLLSIIGCPVRRSAARRREFPRSSAGRSSKSVLPIRSAGPASRCGVAVAWLAMTKRLLTSLTQRLSGTRSISACSDSRSSAIARAREFGDVLVGRHPAAVGHRLETNFDLSSAREPRTPGSRRLVGAHRIAQVDIILDRAGPASGHELAFGNVAQRRARHDFVRGKAVDLGEAPVAADQPAFGIEEGNALSDILDRRLIARRPRFKGRDDGSLLTDDDVLRLDHGSAQRDQPWVVVSIGQRRGMPVVQAESRSEYSGTERKSTDLIERKSAIDCSEFLSIYVRSLK